MINIKIDPSAERTILDFRKLGFDDVMTLGRYHYTHVHGALAPHTHGDMVEICLLDQGQQSYTVGQENYTLRGGDAFFTLPNELHGTGGHPEDRGTLYWLLIRVPKRHEPFLLLAPCEQARLFHELFHLPSRRFNSQGRLRPHLLRIMETAQDDSDPLRIINLKNWMLRFLLDFIEVGNQWHAPVVTTPIRRVQDYVADHLKQTMPVAELAQVAGLSVSRFNIRFRQETGMSPTDYLMREKIAVAQWQLAETARSITDIGLDLGFSSSQYFATVFAKYVGTSPRLFRTGAKKLDSGNPTKPKHTARLRW